MTVRTGCNNSVRLIPGNFAGEECLFRQGGWDCRSGLSCRAYRVSDLMNYPSSDVLSARSYFPAAIGQLLPDAAKENSRARACRFPMTNCKARNPVRAAVQTTAAVKTAGMPKQPSGDFVLSAVSSQYLLQQVNA